MYLAIDLFIFSDVQRDGGVFDGVLNA